MANIRADEQAVQDINILAKFLAHEEVTTEQLAGDATYDCIILCVSALIVQAEELFHILEARPSLTKCLLLVGGVGHSTEHLWDAIEQHEQYKDLASEVRGLPEARVMEKVIYRYFDIDRITSQGCQILIEDQSTNCGSNAIEAKKVLDAAGFSGLKNSLVVQDPTMSLRTLKSFQKAYEPHTTKPTFLSSPFFLPMVAPGPVSHQLTFDTDFSPSSLWPLHRFLSLIVGEIPRLRDDANGYGPKGKGFIGHVEVPTPVEASWSRLQALIGNNNDRLP